MKRTPLRRTSNARQHRDTGPSADVRRMVVARARWACERCGHSILSSKGSDIHHRKPRRMGGTSDPAINSPANLVLLCRDCHRDIESNRLLAARSGWLVSAALDPEMIPLITDKPGGRFYLTPDGRYSVEPPRTVR